MEEKAFDPVAVTRRLTKIDPSTAPERDREWGLSAIDRLACWQAALRAELSNPCSAPRPEPDGDGEAAHGATTAGGVEPNADPAADSSAADSSAAGGRGGDANDGDANDGDATDGGDEPNPELDRVPPLSWRERMLLERRSDMLGLAKLFAGALRAGRIAPDHVDVLASVLREVQPAIRTRVLQREADLLVLAQRLLPPQFGNAVRRAVDRASAEEGLSLAARLLANTRLKQWDGTDGLHHVHITLDPEHAGQFNAALQAEVEALFHSGEHPDLDHEQRAARALVNLVTSGQAAPRRSDPGRAQFLILADFDTLFGGLHDQSVLETAGGRSVHLETARRLWCDAESVTWVLTIKGSVLALVTEDELANRNQRRAMRSMYRGCVHPDCGVGFDRCHLHHVVFRHRGGKTVLGNLVPVCYRHHHLIHEGGWTLTMNAARTIEWRRPDGSLYARVAHVPIGVDDQLGNGPPAPPGQAPPGHAPPGQLDPPGAPGRADPPGAPDPPGGRGANGPGPQPSLFDPAA